MSADSGSYEEMKSLDPVLTKKYITDAANAYISGEGDPSDPRFSPLFGELAGLPPVYIMAGRNEILLDAVLLAIQDRPQVQVRIRRGSCLIYDRFCL